MRKISAIEIVLGVDEFIDQRIINILSCLIKNFIWLNIQLSNIETVGETDSKLNRIRHGKIDESDVAMILNKIGGGVQILELDIKFESSTLSIWVLVRDGQDINIVTNNISQLSICELGKYKLINSELFDF